MNIHHLELFYYVARPAHQRAVRNIPYASAAGMSGQIIQLESSGVDIVPAAPIALTSTGESFTSHKTVFR